MGLKNTRKQIVEEVPYGMYVWELPSGEILGDGDGNVMNCFAWSAKERPAAKAAITQAAKHYGHAEGNARWWSGVRPIDDEQLAEQLARAEAGLTPDPLDIAAYRDDVRNMEQTKND